MPLPPAPTQRASLISNQSIADHQKAIPSPVLSSNTGTVSKKSTPKPDLVLLKSGYQDSEMALPAKAVTRTFNVLAGEGRRVLMALLPIA